ncbi:NACHT, LRR and PYD domains-containing protein 1a allele 5-like [Vicugna pacos]|uniref:NACHT, LRR and PYD domains-containing protein 1a allele 5-like n=1 Tax=Vicugna pacos TaxID=30538 RepID=A0A6J0ACP1_VICPA
MRRGSRVEGGAGGPRRVGDDDGLQKTRQSQAAWRATEVPHRETVKVCAGVSGGVTGQEGVQVHACDDHSASSEEKDCPSPNLDTSEDSKSAEDSSSESSSESESDNEEPKPKQTNGELGESSTEEASTQVEEWEDKGLPTDHFNSEFNKIQSHCEHCKAENKHNEPVTPRLLSRGQFLLKVDTEGVYQCTETGLIFEVNRKVDIKYCVLSWSKYADLVVKPWVVGGPLFDVKCDPTCLTSIQFPHSLCLGHCDTNMTFKVLHVQSTGASLEYTVDHSATHVKWRVSSLSPVGPVIQSEETVFHHGAVILYKAIDHNPSLSFRVYIATNNESFIKDISKSIKHSSKKFMKVDKPPVCLKLLQNGKKYRLISEPEAEITPEEIEFVDGSLLKLKSYIEVYLEQPVEFKLLLVEMDSEEIVWKAKLRECDWIQQDRNRNISKSSTSGNRRRKMSSSLPDEVVYDKRMKQIDTSDGAKTKALLTDTQLISLAEKLGQEWVKIAIANLKLKISDIDAIMEKKEDVTMNKFRMLKKWQEKEQSNATAQNLCNCLKNVDSVEVQDVLRGFLQET